MEAVARLPVGKHLAWMETLVAAAKTIDLKEDEIGDLLHPKNGNRHSLLEDNRDHPRSRSLRKEIAKVAVEKLGLPAELAKELSEDSSGDRQTSRDTPPWRRLNAAGEAFEAEPPDGKG
jgi:hypothetical protein